MCQLIDWLIRLILLELEDVKVLPLADLEELLSYLDQYFVAEMNTGREAILLLCRMADLGLKIE